MLNALYTKIDIARATEDYNSRGANTLNVRCSTIFVQFSRYNSMPSGIDLVMSENSNLEHVLAAGLKFKCAKQKLGISKHEYSLFMGHG
jgi:hypothetical protein